MYDRKAHEGMSRNAKGHMRAATGTVPFGKRLERMLVWMLNHYIQFYSLSVTARVDCIAGYHLMCFTAVPHCNEAAMLQQELRYKPHYPQALPRHMDCLTSYCVIYVHTVLAIKSLFAELKYLCEFREQYGIRKNKTTKMYVDSGVERTQLTGAIHEIKT